MAILDKSIIKYELENLKGFLEDVEFKVEIICENELFTEPTLILGMPYDDEHERIFVCNFLPISNEDAEYTKFFHMITEIPFDVSEIPESTICKIINRINTLCTLGTFIYAPTTGETPAIIQYRYTISASLDDMIDEGSVCECLFLMSYYCEVIEIVLSKIHAGEDIEKAMEELMHIVKNNTKVK